jgi:hypothetical protein
VKLSDLFHIPAACPQEKNPKYPLNRRLGDPEPVWTFAKEKNFLPLQGMKHQTIQHIAQSLYQHMVGTITNLEYVCKELLRDL